LSSTQGTQTYTFSGLSSTTTYYFKIYSYTNSGTDINYKLDGIIPQINGLTTAPTTSATDYFRSKVTGDWNATGTWESSPTGIDGSWINASLTPDNNANTITILNGHTVTITASVTVDQVIVNNGGVVENNTGTLTINNGTGDDFTIENGGIYKVTNTSTYATAISFSASSTMLVKTGGTISVDVTANGNTGYSTSSNVVWEDASIFNWNTTSTLASSGVTYFPNNTTTFPTMKIQQNPSFSIGGASATTFNCVLEVNAIINFQNAGLKTFNKGITGGGTINQLSAGQLIFASSDGIGSNLTLNVGANGVSVSSPYTLNVSGILVCGTNLITGIGAFALNTGSTLKIGSLDGISTSGATGNIQVTGTRTFDNAANYEYNGASAQATGNGLPTTLTGNLTASNTNASGVTLSNSYTLNSPSVCTVSGILDCSSFAISGTGTFTLSSGGTLKTANATGVNGSITVSGTKTFSSGANYEFNGVLAQVTGMSTTINNLTINNSAGVTLSQATTVNGDLSLTSGTFADGGNILQLAGNLTGTGSHSGSGKIHMTGLGGKTISGATLTNLQLNNIDGFSLSGSPTVNGTFTFGNGKLKLGANNLTLGSSATLIGIYSSSYIVTDGAGVLINTVGTASLVLFPIGTTTAYAPVWLQEATTGRDYSARVEPDATGSNSGADRVQLKWTVSNITGGTPNATLKVQWPLSVEGSNFVRATQAKFFDIALGTEMGTGLYTTQFDTDPFSLQKSGISAFSPLGVGPNIETLPVELSSFTSNIITRDVKLNWTTASENNNAGFEILRSAQNDNGSWTKVGYVTGNGTKTTPTNYSFEDKKLNTGKYKYRLKQIDFNGNFEYFNLAGEIEIGVPKKFEISQNYPNPFNPTAKIDFDLPYDSKVSMKLYDISGREVMTLVNEQKSAGYYTVQMNGNNLSSGMYFYRIIAEGNGQKYVMTKKAILIK